MHQLILIIFLVGYLLITLEHSIKIDKAALAILTAALTWVVLALGGEGDSHVFQELRHHLGEISEIVYFLMGAMVIVELIDAHDGFRIITDRITTKNRVGLLWIVSALTFFISPVLDNLTTTIVMLSLLRQLIADQKERWVYAGVVVIAANAGGAWSPIGDVTTTMLWIGNQITAINIIKELFIPSVVCLLVPLIWLSISMKGDVISQDKKILQPVEGDVTTPFERNLVFILGLGALIFVPLFKNVTHLPPYMGILFGLSVLWIVTEMLHHGKNEEIKQPLSVAGVLQRIDISSILFFLGILLAVSSLATAGHLAILAESLRNHLHNIYAINIAIGSLSSLVDNVPLVAGAAKMYPLVTPDQLSMATVDQHAWLAFFVQDGHFWELLAYCAGTGGSCLIIGSAAGVVAMGMEKIPFFWYMKYICWLALLGYLSGAFVFFSLIAS